MAQGVAWGARERGVSCTVVVPDTAPKTKLDAIERLGGRILPVPFEDWWRAIETSQHPGAEGYFVHPVLDDGVMAGNGTIGLEILEDLPDVDAVLVPWGGGGLTSGIASALKRQKPGVRVIACEPETGAPLDGVAAHRRVEVRGLPRILRRRLGQPGAAAEDVGPRAGAASTTRPRCSLDATAAAVRLLAERARVVAEGAGGLSLAAARAGHGGSGKVVCIVSGGNIDSRGCQDPDRRDPGLIAGTIGSRDRQS